MKNSYRIFLALLFLTFSAGLVVAEEIEQLITERIFTQYKLDSESYEVELISHRLKAFDIEPEELVLKEISNKEPLGLFTLQGSIVRDQKILSRGQVRVRIKKFETVLVALDRFSRHDDLETTRFTLKRMDVSKLRERPLTDTEALAGYRARLSIRKEQIITTDLIELVPDIEVGREIVIILHSELIRITAPGRAMQSGSKGDLVRVKNKATGRVVLARILDRNSVAIDL